MQFSLIGTKYVKYAAFLLILQGLSACATIPPQIPVGMAASKAGYVPARIAVLPCKLWPAEARFETLAIPNTAKEIPADLCTNFDKVVLDGFRDQPYMKGFTPTAVAKLIAASPKGAGVLEQLDGLWHHLSSDCHQCSNFPSFYHQSIEPRENWRKWLNTFSSLTRNSDAILIPFVLYTQQARVNDRGMLRSEISAGVGLLLLDTNNGSIIWSNERQSNYATSILESLWKDFPGRLLL